MACVAAADALIEGNRPGVMERLGLGPADCAAHNPKLVYGRMTGWGQSGPLAQAAGHDLNYVALTGLLSLSAHPGERPIVPPTVLGDAGGALGLAFGIACALIDARSSCHGRVVDGAIVDVVAMLGAIAQWVRGSGQIDGLEPSPFHDSPFYDVYACADGGFICEGPERPKSDPQNNEKQQIRKGNIRMRNESQKNQNQTVWHCAHAEDISAAC
jgi:alpha-methylacyl-CoA racemase